ncbi:MAG: DUF927 domain-containing protein [Defluviicoccus sp.]|nr:DUF927 domain-containing protein [Defluviicoccus sp.]
MPTPNASAPRRWHGEARDNVSGLVKPRGNSTTVADVLGRLEGVRRSGDGWAAKCPAHPDRHASLSVSEGDNGRPLLHCHAGCTFEAIAAAVGKVRGDFAQRPAAPRAPKPPKAEAGELVSPIPEDAPPIPAHPAHGRPAATWTYRDPEHRPLFHVCRFDHADGRKDVLPLTLWREDGALRWRWKGYPKPRPLYGLHRLAARPDAPVLIVEGEKAADAVGALLPDFVAITSPGGAANAKHADWSPLAGRRCIIWPDADEPGAAYAADVDSLALEAGAAAVSRVDLDALEAVRGESLPKGWDAADALAEGLKVAELPTLAANDADEPAAPEPPRLPRFEVVEFRKGWRNGVYWLGVERDKMTGDERPEPPVWVCSPLYVTANTRDELGGEWGRLLVWIDRDGRAHRWAMPCETLAGSGEELRGALLRGGVEITSHPHERRRLADYIAWSRPAITARAVTRTGWHGSAFVYPHRTEGDTEAEPILYQAAHVEGLRLGTAGTLEGWRAKVAMPAAGNSRVVLALSASFAAPCLGLLGAEGGGLHLRGESSTGKSTALSVAASAWGPPDYLRTWRATDNALEGIAAQHSDLLLCLDEMGELPPKVAGATAYMLANGSGKSRAHRDGTARAAARWRLLFLSTGEIGLADLIAEAGGRTRAGQEVRVIDLPADAGAGLGLFERLPAGMRPGAFADALKDAAAIHYGHAGPAFVAELVKRHGEARDALRTACDAIAAKMVPADAAGQVRRVAQRFALVAAAGELATEYGLTGWREGEAARAAAVCFRAWLSARGTAGAAEPAAMLAQVRGFLEAHGESRFAPMDQADNRATINRAGFRRETSEGTEYLILRESFREICTGFDHKAVAKALAEAGALTRDNDGGTTKPERLPGLGLTRCYVITAAIWSAGNA